MPNLLCKYCNQPLHIEHQECAPFTRDANGHLIALGSMVQADCRNPGCEAYFITGNGPNFQTTIDHYVAYNRLMKAEASHA